MMCATAQYCECILAKKEKYSVLLTQHRKWTRKKNQALLECFFPYSKGLAFQDLKINSVPHNMRQFFELCCYSKCGMIKCSTGSSFLGKQMDFQGTLLCSLRATTERKLWEVLDIAYFIFIYSSQTEIKFTQFMFFVSMDSKHFSTTLTHLRLFLQLNLVNEKAQLLASLFTFGFFSTNCYWNHSNLVDHFTCLKILFPRGYYSNGNGVRNSSLWSISRKKGHKKR